MRLTGTQNLSRNILYTADSRQAYWFLHWKIFLEKWMASTQRIWGSVFRGARSLLLAFVKTVLQPQERLFKKRMSVENICEQIPFTNLKFFFSGKSRKASLDAWEMATLNKWFLALHVFQNVVKVHNATVSHACFRQWQRNSSHCTNNTRLKPREPCLPHAHCKTKASAVPSSRVRVDRHTEQHPLLAAWQ